LPGWELFSAARIVDEWGVWEDLRRNQFVPEDYTSEPEGSILGDEWWRLAWIPFCGDGGGNHLCVDLDPAPGGTAGQVITMWARCRRAAADRDESH
jgi:molybdopterin molybdotransferase